MVFIASHGRFRSRLRFPATVALAALLALCALGGVAAQPPGGPPAGGPPGGAAGPPPPPSANVSVFATGVEAPRGLRFGPDGNLYVAEAGMGGTNSTAGQCMQVPAIGPYTGGKTSRISKISATGTRTTFVDGLPSTKDTMGDVLGVADVEFMGGTMYGLIGGGGCSHGNPDTPNAIIKINSDGSWTKVADLSAWAHANLTKAPPQDDFEPDGDWYSMTTANGAFYALDPNHGDFVKVTTDGQITRVADFSGQPWIGPTTVVTHNGAFYISNLGEFPVTEGNAKVWKVTPDGTMSVVATGLEAVLGLAFDGQGQLYALEMSTVPNQGPVPGTGMVLRQNASGGWDTVASGLFFPTAMTFGPDGTLYVSNMGFGPPTGQIVKVNVHAAASAPSASSAPAGSPPAPPTTTTPVVTTPSTPSPTPASSHIIHRLGEG